VSLQVISPLDAPDVPAPSPPSSGRAPSPTVSLVDLAAARRVIDRVRSDGRRQLSEIEAKTLLSAFGIAVVPTPLAAPSTSSVSPGASWARCLSA
jgi:hypothetical protein